MNRNRVGINPFGLPFFAFQGWAPPTVEELRPEVKVTTDIVVLDDGMGLVTTASTENALVMVISEIRCECPRCVLRRELKAYQDDLARILWGPSLVPAISPWQSSVQEIPAGDSKGS